MIDFAKILEDDKTFPDTIELVINNEKVTLGSVRDLSKKSQAQITERLNAAQDRENAAEKARADAIALSEKASEIQSRLEAELEKVSKAGANRGDGSNAEELFETDPWYKPVRTRLQNIEKLATELKDTQANLAKAVGNAATIFAEDRWERQFERVGEGLKKNKKYADWDFNKIKKYAAENKIVDRFGLPSIAAAYEKLTAEDRQALQAEEAYQRGLREGEQRARIGATPKPASAAAASGAGGKAPGSLDEALDPNSIADDAELSQMLAELQNAKL